MLRVQGLASSSPFDAADRNNAANRRISIIVMNREAEERFFRRGMASLAEHRPDTPPTPLRAARRSPNP